MSKQKNNKASVRNTFQDLRTYHFQEGRDDGIHPGYLSQRIKRTKS